MKEDFNRYRNKLENDSRIKSCFVGDDSCSGKITKAHSIQNNRFLASLAEDGHILQLVPEDAKGTLIIKPLEIGRKKPLLKVISVSFMIVKYSLRLRIKTIENLTWNKNFSLLIEASHESIMSKKSQIMHMKL